MKNRTQLSIKINTKFTAILLTYLGVIPFLLAVLISLSQFIPDSIGSPITYAGFKAKAIIHSYSVIILSFLSGIQWGVSMDSQKHSNFILISNVFALISWFSLMAFGSTFAISLLLFCLIAALFTDSFAFKYQLIPEWFWQLRKKVSLIVCIAILIVLFTT